MPVVECAAGNRGEYDREQGSNRGRAPAFAPALDRSLQQPHFLFVTHTGLDTLPRARQTYTRMSADNGLFPLKFVAAGRIVNPAFVLAAPRQDMLHRRRR